MIEEWVVCGTHRVLREGIGLRKGSEFECGMG
jgi:hypothetical protein